MNGITAVNLDEAPSWSAAARVPSSTPGRGLDRILDSNGLQVRTRRSGEAPDKAGSSAVEKSQATYHWRVVHAGQLKTIAELQDGGTAIDG